MNRKIMTPREIKHALDDAGYTQVMVADACKVSQPFVNLVIHNKSTSHNVRCYIAGKIGRPVEDIWMIRDNPTKPGRPLTRLRHQAA